MLNIRRSYSHTFVCVTATLLLIFGYSNYVFAEGKADEHKAPPVSTATPVVQTATDGKQVAMNAATTGQNESQAAAVATPIGSNETDTESNGTTASNDTHTQTNGTTGSSEPHTETNGTTGSNEPHTETNGTTGSNEPHTETNGTTGSNETGTVSNSTRSSNANQTEPKLSIFLVNDLQYDIFPVHPEDGSMCDTYTEAEKCVGGLPSLYKTVVDNANRSQSIWLNAGNTLGGHLFRTLKFDAAVRAMQLLNFSATAVGPSVFKYGGDAGQMYLDGLKQSIVVSNIDPAPQLKSVVLRFGSCNVSVIGYLENTEQDQDIRGVTVKNYTQSVLEEVARIRRNQQNVSNLITVVIGSSSVNKSKILASNETIDFVFFSGGNWSEGNKNGSQLFYYEPMNRRSNRTAYVASLRVNHSSVADRFLVGMIELPLNGCRVLNATFNVLNYSTTTANNPASDLIKSELEALKSQNTSLTLNMKNLTAERGLCCHSECSLGNLITDAMVAALNGDGTWRENDTRIGIFPAVLLQPNATIPQDNVTVMNLYELIDQDEYMYSVLLTGRQLKDMLEVSINSSSNSNSTDFLHVSRLLQIEYRKDRDNKSEIVSVRTVSAVSSSMQLSEVDVNDSATFYNVSLPLTLLQMDTYKKLLSAVNASFHSVTIVEAVTKYINNTRVLSLPVLGSRFIRLEPHPAPPPPSSQCEDHTGITVAVTLLVSALIVAIIVGVWRWRSIRFHLPGYVNF